MISYVFLVFCVVLGARGGFEDDCGLEATPANPLVRLGQTVGANEFPWQVAIFKKEGGQFEQICGGSLVRSRLVITAAHCFSTEIVDHQVNVEDYRVVAGSLRSSWTARSLGRQTKRVQAVRLGERYGGINRNMQNDIAVVHLQTEFIFSPVVRTICLDLMDEQMDNTQTRPGSMGKVAGWGLTESGTPSASLKFLRVSVLGDKQCTEQIFNISSSYTLYITADKICAGNNVSAVCRGDSGGGLVFPLQTTQSPPRFYLRGVLSSTPNAFKVGDVCPMNSIALYTNVFTHRNWLSTNMQELQPQEGCRVKGSAGVCRDFSACPRALEEATRGILPQYCSPSSTKICCVESVAKCPPLPPSVVSTRKTGSKAHDYCIELAEKIHPCQETSSGWTRGDLCPLLTPDSDIVYHYTPITTTAEAPYFGRFGSGQRGDIYWWYPVTLVSDQWVLCSAAVIEGIGSSNVKFVGLGGALTPQYNPDEIFEVTAQQIHPLYNHSYSYVYNSIALLQLDRRVTFTARILPACLHTGTPLPDSGFILTDFYGKTTMQRLSQEECSRAVPTGRGFSHPAGVKHDLEICSRPVNTTERCPGWFVGAPLTLHNSQRVKCTHLLVGLISSGISSPCTVTNTRISSFIPWVEGIVWP